MEESPLGGQPDRGEESIGNRPSAHPGQAVAAEAMITAMVQHAYPYMTESEQIEFRRILAELPENGDTTQILESVGTLYDGAMAVAGAKTPQRIELENEAIKWGIPKVEVDISNGPELEEMISQAQDVSPVDLIVNQIRILEEVITPGVEIDLTSIDTDDRRLLQLASLQLEFRRWREGIDLELSKKSLGNGYPSEVSGYSDASDRELAELWIAQKLLPYVNKDDARLTHLKKSHEERLTDPNSTRLERVQSKSAIELTEQAEAIARTYIGRGFLPVIEKTLFDFTNDVFTQTSRGMDLNTIFARYFGETLATFNLDRDTTRVFNNFRVPNFITGAGINSLSLSEIPLPSSVNSVLYKQQMIDGNKFAIGTSREDAKVHAATEDRFLRNTYKIGRELHTRYTNLEGMETLAHARENDTVMDLQTLRNRMVVRALLDATFFASKEDPSTGTRYRPQDSEAVRLAQIVDRLLGTEHPTPKRPQISYAAMQKAAINLANTAGIIRDSVSLEQIEDDGRLWVEGHDTFEDILTAMQFQGSNLRLRGVARYKTRVDKGKTARITFAETALDSLQIAVAEREQILQSTDTTREQAMLARSRHRRAMYDVRTALIAGWIRTTTLEEPYFVYQQRTTRPRTSRQSPGATELPIEGMLVGVENAVEKVMNPMGTQAMDVIKEGYTAEYLEAIHVSDPADLTITRTDEDTIIPEAELTELTRFQRFMGVTRLDIHNITPRIQVRIQYKAGLLKKLMTDAANKAQELALTGMSPTQTLAAFPLFGSMLDDGGIERFLIRNQNAIRFGSLDRRENPFTYNINGDIIGIDMPKLNEAERRGLVWIEYEAINPVEVLRFQAENGVISEVAKVQFDEAEFPKGIYGKFIKGISDKWNMWKLVLGTYGMFLDVGYDAKKLFDKLRDALESRVFNVPNQTEVFYRSLGFISEYLAKGTHMTSWIYSRPNKDIWDAIMTGAFVAQHHMTFVRNLLRNDVARTPAESAFDDNSSTRAFWSENTHLIGYRTIAEGSIEDPIQRGSHGEFTVDVSRLGELVKNGDVLIDWGKVEKSVKGVIEVRELPVLMADTVRVELDDMPKSGPGERDKSPKALFDFLQPKLKAEMSPREQMNAMTEAARVNIATILNVLDVENFNALMGWNKAAYKVQNGLKDGDEVSDAEISKWQVTNYLKFARFAGYTWLLNENGTVALSQDDANGYSTTRPILIAPDSNFIIANDVSILKALGLDAKSAGKKVLLKRKNKAKFESIETESAEGDLLTKIFSDNIGIISDVGYLYALMQGAITLRTGLIDSNDTRTSFQKAADVQAVAMKMKLGFELGTQSIPARKIVDTDPIWSIHFQRDISEPADKKKPLKNFQMPKFPVVMAMGPESLKSLIFAANHVLALAVLSREFAEKANIPQYLRPTPETVYDELHKAVPFPADVITQRQTLLPNGKEYTGKFDLHNAVMLSALFGVDTRNETITVSGLFGGTKEVKGRKLTTSKTPDQRTVLSRYNLLFNLFGTPKEPGGKTVAVETAQGIAQYINIGDSTTQGIIKKVFGSAFDGIIPATVTVVTMALNHAGILALLHTAIPLVPGVSDIAAAGATFIFWSLFNNVRLWGIDNPNYKLNLWERLGVAFGAIPSWYNGKTGVGPIPSVAAALQPLSENVYA